MLAHAADLAVEGAEWVIGVDTHRDWHDLAITRVASGEITAELHIDATPSGYAVALRSAQPLAGRRVWSVEGSGSYGAGLARFLAARGERVVEAPRPSRRDRRGPKTDQLDAIRAARAVVMGGSIATPRSDGDRDALRLLVTTRQGIVEARTKAINQLHAAVVTAPEPLRGELRDLSRGQLVKRLSHLRPRPTLPRGVSVALTTLARHIQSLDHHEASLKTEINQLTTKLAPQLLNQHGIGPITAAHILIAWSHKGRIRSEAAFAMLAGVAPIPASSGHTTRHRINHGGDRKLNNALHMIATTRLRDPQTKAYINRKQREGKTKKDAIRSLKRYIARNVYRLLEHAPQPT